MEYRDNDVTLVIDPGYTLISASFRVDQFSVTNGQDPDRKIFAGLTVACAGDGKLTFRIGRKGSSQVADWFNAHITASQTTFNHGAGDLNFAMIGQLQLTLTGGIIGGGRQVFTFANIALAQGQSAGSNNWWFGGTACAHVGDNRVSATGTASYNHPVSFTFLRGGNDVSSVGVTPAKLVDTAAWMGQLDQALTLDRIIMPGSHDAGMSDLSHCAPPVGTGGYTQTQGALIGQQLMYGSRYFDIRVDYDYDELVTYHRTGQWGCNGEAVKDVLDQVRSFLAAHPSETAIFKISHIRCYDGHDPIAIKAKLNDLLNAYADILLTNGVSSVNLASVTLGSARGRIIAVFDYPEHIDPATGRFHYTDGDAPQQGSNLTVFDEYSDTSDFDKMMSEQVSKWSQHGELGQGFLFLLSWTLTASPPGPVIRTLASQANGALPDVLSDQVLTHGRPKPNVVYVDFIDNFVGQTIALYNLL